MKKEKIKTLILLHIMLMVYSLSGICGKKASGMDFLSLEFCMYYCLIIMLLGMYAIGWQQIIRRLPLTLAFSNKAITVVWGMIWGAAFFHESITLGKIIGAIVVIVGVVLYSTADKELKNDR